MQADKQVAKKYVSLKVKNNSLRCNSKTSQKKKHERSLIRLWGDVFNQSPRKCLRDLKISLFEICLRRWKYLKCIWDVSEMYLRCIWGVSLCIWDMFELYLYVFEMYLRRLKEVSEMHTCQLGFVIIWKTFTKKFIISIINKTCLKTVLI